MLTNEAIQQLIKAAKSARKYAYAPYSNYRVGAALLTRSGQIYTGVNIESAAYPTSICAERVAVFKAVSEGQRQFSAIAVVTDNGGSPCGSCRQVLAEFGLELDVVIANKDGQITLRKTLADLLPEAFTPRDLGK